MTAFGLVEHGTRGNTAACLSSLASRNKACPEPPVGVEPVPQAPETETPADLNRARAERILPTTALVRDACRLRSFRHSRFATLLYDRDRLSQFWLQDLRRMALFLSLIRESKWLRGDEPGSFSLVTLARESQMSIARTAQVLGICASTGDFVRQWDPRDARYLVFDPSLTARAGLAQFVAACCEAAASLLGRVNPVPVLGPEALQRVYKTFVDQALACLAQGNLDDRALGSLTFFMTMADLALHSPIVAADFVRREAARLRVTTATLRNVLRRAEHDGWIRREGRMLSMPAEARQRMEKAFGVVIMHLAAILDEADAVLASQRQAAGQETAGQETAPDALMLA